MDWQIKWKYQKQQDNVFSSQIRHVIAALIQLELWGDSELGMVLYIMFFFFLRDWLLVGRLSEDRPTAGNSGSCQSDMGKINTRKAICDLTVGRGWFFPILLLHLVIKAAVGIRNAKTSRRSLLPCIAQQVQTAKFYWMLSEINLFRHI